VYDHEATLRRCDSLHHHDPQAMYDPQAVFDPRQYTGQFKTSGSR
jgi:hypothetical protein